MTFSTFASPGVSLQGGGGSSGGGGTPGGSNTQIQYNNSGAFAGASGLTTNGTELTIASGTKTADAPVLNMSQTWNNGAVTFTGLKYNATDTASAAASLLMDLQVGGGSVFSIAKTGDVTLRSPSTSVPPRLYLENDNNAVTASFYQTGGVLVANAANARFVVEGLSGSFGIGSTPSAPDLIFGRRAAANLRFGAADAAAPVAQTLSVQSVVAGTTNAAGANFTITGSQGTGTGAGGSIIFQVAPAGSSGSAQNALATALTINSTLGVSIASSGSSAVSSGAGFSSLSTADFSIYTSGTRNFSFSGNSFIVLGTAPNVVLGSGTSGRIVFDNVGSAQIHREGTGILGQRGSPDYSTGTQAQAFRVYNTYTDATTFERANIFWDSNVLKIGTEKGSVGGTARALEFQTNGTTRLTISAAGPVTVNYVNGLVISDVGGNGFSTSNGGYIIFKSSGVLTLSDATDTSFNRLQFGGTTSSFPALKRSSTTLQARLADDTAFASVQGKLTTDTAYTATVITPTGYLTLYDSTGTAYRVPCVV